MWHLTQHQASSVTLGKLATPMCASSERRRPWLNAKTHAAYCRAPATQPANGGNEAKTKD